MTIARIMKKHKRQEEYMEGIIMTVKTIVLTVLIAIFLILATADTVSKLHGKGK